MTESSNVPYIFGEPSSGEFTLACTTKAEGEDVPFKICLRALHQSLTYAGVLEGSPTQYANQRIVEKKVKNARKLFGDFRPHVIAPREEVINLTDEDLDRTIFVLPAVCCIASFEANYPTKPDAGSYSELTVVWFQGDWAYPMQDEIVSALRSLPWTDLARNCWYRYWFTAVGPIRRNKEETSVPE